MKSLSLFSFAALLPAKALAQAPPEPAASATYALSWVRAEGAEACPAAPALAAEVERRLGRPVFDAKAERSIEVDVMRFGDKYRSDVYVRDAAGRALGHRQLESDEAGCGALLSATALAVALVIDPDAATRPPPSGSASFEAPPPASPASPASSPPVPPPPAPPPVRPAPEPVMALPAPVKTPVSISLRTELAFGLVPLLSPGFALAATARPGRLWGFALSAAYIRSQQISQGIASLDIGLTRGSAWLTYELGRSENASLLLGLGPSVGAFHLAVRKPTPVTNSGDFWFVAAELGSRFQLAATRSICLELGGSVLGLPSRQEFLVRGQSEAVWRQPALAGSVFLGMGALFP